VDVVTTVLLVTDTHLGPGQAPLLVSKLGSLLDDADVIVHAGDVTDASVLAALSEHAPTYAVLGNNDRGLRLPERRRFDVEGCSFAVVHDSGSSAGRAVRLRRWFPDADVVVFGHSHLPWHETDVRRSDGQVQHHINPGSAIQRRRAPTRTAAVVSVSAGAVESVRFVDLP
jgi:putative phosphoesterase